MSDHPQSTPPTFTPPRSIDDLPLVEIGAHPLREAYLAHVHPDYHADLIRPLDLFLAVLLEGHPFPYLPGGHGPDVHDEVAAVGRDLRFCGDFLRGIAREMFDDIPYEEETVTRWCLAFAPKVDALAAELEEFITGAPRPPAEEPK